jgi:ABC-type lipoprotein release transport system permease subunit
VRTIKQIIAVTLLNLRNLPRRFASSAVAVVGVGAVVLVFAAVLSMAAGLERTMLSCRRAVDGRRPRANDVVGRLGRHCSHHA